MLRNKGQFLDCCPILYHCSQFRRLHYQVEQSSLKLSWLRKPLTSLPLLSQISFLKRILSMTRILCSFLSFCGGLWEKWGTGYCHCKKTVALNTKTTELSNQLAYSSGPLSSETGKEGALRFALTNPSWFGCGLFPHAAAPLNLRLSILHLMGMWEIERWSLIPMISPSFLLCSTNTEISS